MVPGPSWRWDRACLLARRRHTTAEDAPTRRAVRFIRWSRRLCSERGVRRVTKQFPDLVQALKIYQDAGPRHLELRYRILARQSDRDISRTMGLTTPIVSTYRALFFDLEDRLDRAGYIHRLVIRMPVGQPPSREALMMLSAYHHGPVAVDAWLDFLLYAGEEHDLATPEGRRREAIELLLAAHQLPSNAATKRSLVRGFGRLAARAKLLRPARTPRAIVAAYAARVVHAAKWREAPKYARFAADDGDQLPRLPKKPPSRQSA